MPKNPDKQNKSLETAKGGVAAPASFQPSLSPAPKKPARKTILIVVAVLLAILLIVILVLGALIVNKNRSGAPDHDSTNTLSSSLSVPSSVPESYPASSLAASSSVPEEPVADPWPELTFTAEEIARVDQVLAAWAAVSEEDEENGHTVAVYFRDIHSGAEYIYNGERKFPIASLNKAPYAMYLYHLVEQGVCSLADTFYITPEMMEASQEYSGRIKDDPTLPRHYSLDELIEYLLRYSDTGALRVLLARYPAAGYIEYLQSFDLHYIEDVRNVTNGRICAEDAGVYLENMYEYMLAGEYGAVFEEHLLQSQYSMIRSQNPVAHKYGWDINAYHDMAVVFGEHPYLLAILTDKSAGTSAELGMFSTITGLFEDIMGEKWAAVA